MWGILDLSLEELTCSAGGFGVALAHNWMRKRPPYAGVYAHVAYTLVGFYMGNAIKNYKNKMQRNKWVVYEDYMQLHPEEFEEPSPKYFKDVLLPWNPVR